MTTLPASAQNQLRQFVEQIERLEDERKALGGDIKDKFAELKAMGFDAKIVKKVIAIRKKSKSEREEEDAVLDTYLAALEGTPLGDWAARQGKSDDARH